MPTQNHVIIVKKLVITIEVYVQKDLSSSLLVEDNMRWCNGALKLEVHVRGRCEYEEWIIRRETVCFVRNSSCSTVFSLCSSLSIAITWQIIYVSNPCCALSMSWFTLRTIFGGSVIDTEHCPCHGSPYEPYLVN